MHLHQVIEYGAIVAADDDTLVTAGSQYLNLWVRDGATHWTNIDCRSFDTLPDIRQAPLAAVEELAEDFLRDALLIY